MKKLLLIFCFQAAIAASAQSDHLVISQVFGGGGNTNAPFTHDFIELFNPTREPVVLDGMSLQYSGAVSATWSSNKVLLSGTIAAGQYYLIQLTSGGTSGAALPAPDLASTAITLSASSGKVALVRNLLTLSGNCPADALIDMVGYGGADCFEEAVAPATSNSTSLKRIDQGCTDRNNNATDFVVSIPDPRNSKAHSHSCDGSFIITTVTGNPFCIDDTRSAQGQLDFIATGNFANSIAEVVLSDVNGSFVTYSVVSTTRVDGSNPSGTIPFVIPPGLPSGTNYRLRLQSEQPSVTGTSKEIEIINKTKDPGQLSAAPYAHELLLQWTNPSGCFDEIMIVVKEHTEVKGIPSGDGSAYVADLDFSGNGSVFDGGKVVYKGTVTGQPVSGLNNGTVYYVKAFSRSGSYWSTGVSVAEMPRVIPLPGEIVINQISPDFNGAQDEYIELVNLSSKTFDLADLALRFTNADGRNVVAGGTLSGLLKPHSYWLLSPNASITVGKTKDLVPDQVIDGGFGAQNQQVGLVRKTDNTLIDALAYGTVNVPVYVETIAALNPPADGGLKRTTDGADANNNRMDFARVAQADIDLQNSRSRLANKNAILQAGDYRVVKVTGNASISGIISAKKTELGAGTLSIAGFRMVTDTITGGNDTTYIRTNGTGSLTVQNVDSVLFPVGNSTYNPVTIIHGEKKAWQVTVTDDLLNNNTAFSPATAVLRTWHIYPLLPISSGAKIIFEYNDQDQKQVGSGFNKEGRVDIWNFHNNSWLNTGATQVPFVTATKSKAVVLPNHQLFSPFSIANLQVPLAVRFSGFRALPQADRVHLEFYNESESEVKKYVLERSTNGKDFITILSIPPKQNNNSRVYYQVTDPRPFAGYNFYRIKSEEVSGVVTYTYVVKVSTVKTTRVLSVIPNPVAGRLMHWEGTLPKADYQLTITNSAGSQILTQKLQHAGGNAYGTIALPPGITPGVYIMQLRNKEKQLQVRFIVK